jgi:signal peptidase
VRGKDIPIVHRVVRSFPEVEGKAKKVKEITVYVLDNFMFTASYALMQNSSDSTPSHMLLTKVCLVTSTAFWILSMLISYAFR